MSTLKHLEKLVSFDTQNPPRKIMPDSEIFSYLKENLSGFEFSTDDQGDGCISLLAVRGNPKLLFNFHIDTVPVCDNWTSDPFKLKVNDNKAYGLGACDIKGASACMLSAVNQTKEAVALLFTSDEEHGSSIAVKSFLKKTYIFTHVIVAEPTGAKAVLAHRGIQSAKASFIGVSGHGSEARAITDSAVHKAGNWINASLSWVNQQTQSFESLSGLPFNIGKIDGGIKANMIAASCDLSFGFRPLPGQNSFDILDELQKLIPKKSSPKIQNGFFGPTLPAANQNFDDAIEKSKLLASQNSLPIGSPVNFWTEASLFSEAGLTALVFGPGDIKQAHTADEWVQLEQLKLVEQTYIEIIEKKNEH